MCTTLKDQINVELLAFIRQAAADEGMARHRERRRVAV